MDSPIKQRHSIAGHIYNNVCGRRCIKLNNKYPWHKCICKNTNNFSNQNKKTELNKKEFYEKLNGEIFITII